MLPDFITESERFSTLEGNVGRKVTRYMDQLFEHGMFASTFECLAGADLVDFALFLLRLQKCKENLADDVAAKFSICIRATEVHSVVKVVIIPLKEYEGMRDKQALLADFASIMRRFVTYAMMTDRACLDKLRVEQLEKRAFTSDHVQYSYLAELANSDYTHLEHTAGNFVTLAAALNPAVAVEFRACLARDRIEA